MKSRRSIAFQQLESLRFISILLSIYGINIKKNKSKCKIIFVLHLIIVNMAWLLIISSTSCCLYDNHSSFHLFFLILQIMSYCVWWMLFVKKRNCERTINVIGKMRKRKNGLRFSAISCVCMYGVAIIVPSALVIYRFFYKNQDTNGSCEQIWLVISPRSLRFAYKLVHQILRHSFTIAFAYIVASLYYLICMELNNAICYVTRKKSLADSRKYVSYCIAVKALKEIERSMAGIVSFVLLICFVAFIRSLTDFISHYMENKGSEGLITIFCFFLGSFVSFVIVVVGADKVQSSFQEMRQMVLSNLDKISMTESSFSEFTSMCLILIEDKSNIQLTAWKMFEVHRGLLLTAVASLISYSFLLNQFKI